MSDHDAVVALTAKATDLANKLFQHPSHGALRLAFVELVAPALIKARRDALEEAAKLVSEDWWEDLIAEDIRALIGGEEAP